MRFILTNTGKRNLHEFHPAFIASTLQIGFRTNGGKLLASYHLQARVKEPFDFIIKHSSSVVPLKRWKDLVLVFGNGAPFTLAQLPKKWLYKAEVSGNIVWKPDPSGGTLSVHYPDGCLRTTRPREQDKKFFDLSFFDDDL